MSGSSFRSPACLVAALLSVGCQEPSIDRISDLQVRDSAGVTVVRNSQSDIPLDWSFERLWTLGGAQDGPEAFFRVDGDALATDGKSRLYVLDRGNHRVHVFARAATYLRSFGSEGDGPGEMRFPFALAVSRSGTVSVVDFGKGALVRYDSSGASLPEVPLGRPHLLDPAYLEGRLVAMLRNEAAAIDSTMTELVAVEEDGFATLARHRSPPPVDVDLGCARVRGLPRVFEAEMQIAVLGPSTGILVSRAPEYELELIDGAGRLRRRISRDIPPRPASARLAAAELGRDRLVFPGSGGQRCEVNVDEVVEARGFADVVPHVRDLIPTPDGGWWVERGIGPSGSHYDVFSPDGRYIGSLPKGVPRPALFLADDLFVAVERDQLDRVLLVGHRVAM